MKLKSLELFGFKSFAERTVFHLDDGVTAIVGPNGCGKSNTVDAVKWVLGEQRARSLRGQAMTDVIFNGSSTRAPLDLAEVTLRFDNADGTLPIEGAEVLVTRRLYRSGESEYLINNQGARLKDVRELFMGTGLGPGGYSFMEQGKIDSVLASNPIDRRKVFEEAAGISRFRSRRRETELKLDKVESNLLRLADILEELGRQQRSLKIQAGKAERYQEHGRRVRELQAQVALYRYDNASVRREEIARELAELENDKGGRVGRQTELKAELTAVDEELAGVTEKLTRSREAAADVGARQQAARDLADFHQRHLENLEEREKARRGAIEELEQDLERGVAEREQLQSDRAALEQELAGKKTALESAETAVAALRERMSHVEGDVKKAAESVDSLARRHAELDRQHAGIEADEHRWQDEHERAEEGLADRGREREALTASHGESEARLREANGRLEQGKSELEAARTRVRELESSIATLIDERNALLAERSRLDGRIEALEGHIERREGLDEGVRAVLAERESKSDFLPGCRGLLLDLFKADLDSADAFEAALGDLAQAIVVETVDEALQGADFLAEAGRGRAAFLALEAFPEAEGELPAGLIAESSAARRILGAFLGGLDVIEPERLVERVRAGLETGAVVVTTGGALVRDGRIFITGNRKGQQGLVAVRSELEQLRADRAANETRLEASAEQGRELEGKRVEEREALEALEERVAADESATRGLGHEVEALGRQLERLAAEIETLGARKQKAREELDRLVVERERNEGSLEELKAALDQARTSREETSESRDELRARLDSEAAALESHRVEVNSATHRLEAMTNSLEHLERRRSDAERAITRYREELGTFAGDRERSAASAAEEVEKAERLQKELENSRETIAAIESEVATVRERHRAAAAALDDVEADLGDLGEKLHKLQMQDGELRVTMEGLVEHVEEELELDLAELHREYEPAEGVDWQAIETELEERRALLRKLGNVNLAAIDDLKEVEERLEFLSAQSNDLQQSKQQLARILRDIEAESTRLFVETFERVREQFQVMFRKLFGGGRADITLVDPENVLESGIEITARPPGKEARSITLLSGGERTLTAVSLLFSIIRAHPCPCCLMDEVDAALDEDNTERFCQLLDEFLDRTQFILITHSRRTMARADVLFGVTMGERGVSRHVGVRFEDVADDGSFVERDENGDVRADRARGAKGGRISGGRSARGADPGLRSEEEEGEANDPEPSPGDGNGNGNGNGNGKGGKKNRLIGSELLVDLTMAEEGEDPGGRAAEATE